MYSKNICVIFFVLLITTLISALVDDGILLGRGTAADPSQDTSTEITRQTARHFVAFRWELEDATDAEFCIGTTAFPEKFAAWQDLTSREGGADADGYIVEVHVFTGEIPQIGEELRIMIRDGDSVIADPAPSSLLTVGSTNFGSCPGYYDPQPILGGEYTVPPQPDTPTMEYNDVTGKFDFTLDVKYLQFDYTWVVDFVPFENDGTLGTNGLAVTECENHVETEFAGRTFAEYWNAYPAATTNEINSNNYLGYQHETSSATNYADWVLSQVDCSTLRYTASILPSDLSSCQNNANVQAITVTNDDANSQIVIDGALYATAIRPRDLTDSTPADSGADFESVSYGFPFQFRFNYFAEEITQTTASNTFAFTIDKLELTAGTSAGNYKMKITITTNTKHANFYLTDATVVSEPAGIDIEFDVTGPANAQYQTWTLTTTTQRTAGQGFGGSYNLSWTRTDGVDSTTEVANFAISLSVATPQTDLGELDIALAHYTGNTFAAVRGTTTYKKTDRVYIRSEVKRINDVGAPVTLAASEQNSFNNDIWAVYICYVTSGGAPTDCRTETLTVRPVVTLISGGNVVTGVLADQFNAHTFQGLSPSILAGFDFLAQPLVALRGGNGGDFYVQVQSKIVNGSLKRKIQETMYIVKSGVNGFVVEDVTADPDPSSASVILPTLFSMIIFVLSYMLV